MRFLTYSQCAEWCSERGFPTLQLPGYIVGPTPFLEDAPQFHFAWFDLPPDSGKKVWLAKFLCSLLEPSPELLIWPGDWAVWHNHMPLFTRFREALGERRLLIEAPGHLVAPGEADDAVSIIVVSLLFVWNCHILAASGRDAVFVSHDEYGWFASMDASVAASRAEALQGAGVSPARV
jgi:hypothetical protein